MSVPKMQNSRRDIFKFAGGAMAGAVLTPAPWRLITDTALWSENWPGVPRPARGEIRAKFTNCALCPAGCAVRARCVGDQPVLLTGVRGGLCPFGLSAHHLPYHPARLRKGPAAEATAAVTARAAQGIAVLDLNPGRTVSWTYRRAMASLQGTYLIPQAQPFAYDLSAAKTVLSIGAPLLDGWGTPASVLAARPNFRLIQAEAIESRTAVLADEWIPLAPGTERVFVRSVPDMENAGELSLVLGDSPEIPSINHRLGAFGKTIFGRPEAPVPDSWTRAAAPATEFADVPDHSIAVLLIDEASATSYIPWHRIEQKLVRENPLVVTFASSRGGYARHTSYALPTAVYPEVLGDVAAPVDAIRPVFRISAPLTAAPAGVASLAEFVGSLAGLAAATALRERADAIHHTAQGTLLTYADGKQTPVKDLTADAFWKSLNEGGEWKQEDAKPLPALPARLVQAPAEVSETPADLPLIAIADPQFHALVSPLMTKIYQESNLCLAPNRIALHPTDARAAGVAEGGRAVLQTRIGKCAVEVTVDASVPAGAVQLGTAPGIQDVCGNAARAKVVRS